MATRNLTKRFVELRNGAKANRSLGVTRESDAGDGESGLLKVRRFDRLSLSDKVSKFQQLCFEKKGGDSTDWKASRMALPPDWVERIEAVEEDCNKIKTKSAS